jgi:hypothetical protein
MPFTPQQKKEAYKKLSPEKQDFVMSEETTELIDNYLIETGLLEEQSDQANIEIFHALLGLQTLAEAITSIAALLNKNRSDLSKLETDLQEQIFDKIPKTTETEISNNEVIIPEQKQEKEEPQTSGVGESFEQIILNQVKAMMPARAIGEAPQNLPTADEILQDTSNVSSIPNVSKPETPEISKKTGVIHNYLPGQDPYREPAA